MTSAVTDHYDNLLGPLYAWMVGDIDAALARSAAEIDSLGLTVGTDKSTGAATAAGAGARGGTGPGSEREPRIAIDLGAGFGMHALPLARRGLSVIALDTHEPLLNQLRSRAGSLDIRTVNASLLDFRAHLDRPAAVIVCMGDTLTHLADHHEVEALLSDVAESLASDGTFVTTFRDYVSAPLQGEARFIQVRSDERRILTCFLEYADTTVRVHDLVHEKDGETWRLRVSSYPKLRLSPAWVAGKLEIHGLTVHRSPGPAGMVRLVAAHAKHPALSTP
jgi:Methyltransferase domain